MSDFIVYARHDCQPNHYNFTFKITSPQQVSLDGQKIELLLYWQWPIVDYRSQMWYVQPSGTASVTAEAAGGNLVKFTLAFGGGLSLTNFDHQMQRYFAEVSFGIWHKDFHNLNKTGSPALHDLSGNLIPCSGSNLTVFPNINIGDPVPPPQKKMILPYINYQGAF